MKRSRTDQSFCVPKGEIAGNDYDLSINRYKEVVHAQATFVKQANIAHGPQQVNNGIALPDGLAHTEKTKPEQNKLLEGASYGRTYLDTGATPKTAGSHQEVAAVEKVYRPAKRRG